ncbi:MAG: hypothetical protein NUV52_00940 [Candidatus Roizmanbacteria bacterium]|nr:hypothetical protein [Candidatus Roizmanbacteria bacterium]
MNTNNKIIGLIALLVVLFFFGAFSINFIVDDFYFLKISRVETLSDITAFFSPLRTTFYRPLASEVFYAIITLLGRNIYLAHMLVFAVYILGIAALYRSIKHISGNIVFACCGALLYALHSTHVFQLYTFNTFQEVLMMTTLAWSFWMLLQKKYATSQVFFIAALLSKENAVLYPGILLAAKVLRLHHFPTLSWKHIMLFFGYSAAALLLYVPGTQNVAATESIYTPQFSVSLISNNAFWYTAWAMGAPNFVPDHMRSIFGPVLPTLWPYFDLPFAKLYTASLILYLMGLILGSVMVIRKQNIAWKMAVWYVLFFVIFLTPALPIVHKWMVRLTLPLIPIALAQAWIIAHLVKQHRSFAGILIALYLVTNFASIRVHEITSNYRHQSTLSERVQEYFIKNREDYTFASSYYFVDPIDTDGTAWGWSKQLENTLHGSDFIDHVYPGSKAVVFYGYRKPQIRPNTIPIPADLFIP